MQDKTEKLHLAALVPHGNVIAQLEQERKKLAAAGLLQPFYPFFCPLIFIDELSANPAQRILTRFEDFFQSCSTISVSSKPLVSTGSLYYRLETEFSGMSKDEPFTAVCTVGEFTLRAGSFLFGTLTESYRHPADSAANAPNLENLAGSQTLRVFKLALFSLNWCLTAGGNCSFEWTENAARWIKLR